MSDITGPLSEIDLSKMTVPDPQFMTRTQQSAEPVAISASIGDEEIQHVSDSRANIRVEHPWSMSHIRIHFPAEIENNFELSLLIARFTTGFE